MGINDISIFMQVFIIKSPQYNFIIVHLVILVFIFSRCMNMALPSTIIIRNNFGNFYTIILSIGINPCNSTIFKRIFFCAQIICCAHGASKYTRLLIIITIAD